MAETVVPHFHNDAGVAVIEIGAREFMCIGARPPLDHPHVFLDMGADNEIICPYCSTLYRHDPALDPHAARPPECAYEPTPEPAHVPVRRPGPLAPTSALMSARTIVVAGAGIGGLTAALALAQRGFRVAVVDKAEKLEAAGAGIQLSPNATRVLIGLGLLDALEPAVVVPQAVIVRAADGRAIARMPLGPDAQTRYGAPYWIIHRADLQAVLLAAVRAHHDIELTLGATVDACAAHANGITVQARFARRMTHRRSRLPRSSAPTACGRRCAASPARPIRRAFPAAPPGAPWCRPMPSRRNSARRRSSSGSAAAATSSIIRSAPAR